ncbi:hypothetical protein DL96DRAFT_23037 [Flagelloscypha sp. PMI_526]|nr:hypothetical protein DL96DRAFT_23037 [Flagelloscypha sp. PMI_526]
MDNMGDRFICGACPVERRGRVTGRVARDWRDTILHYVESSEDEAHSIPSWLLLSKMATRDVLLRETRPDDHSREWACCHCGRNWLTNHDTKPETKEHLRDEHDITRPVNGLDMHLYQKYRRPRGGHALLAESILYRCNYCPLSDKLLTKDQLDKHVKGKAHAVLRPGDAEILVKTIENVTVHYPSTELEVEQPKDSTDGDGQ